MLNQDGLNHEMPNESDSSQASPTASDAAATQRVSASVSDESAPLVAALAEIDRHMGQLGWDQPARLFALVRTADLVAAEPSLAEHLAHHDADSLSSIEQEDFREGDDLPLTIERMSWSDAVFGCALAVERSFLPSDAEAELPDDPSEAASAVANHPRRHDVRVVVGVLRDGTTHGLGRLREQPEELLGGPDLVPGLTRLLQGTLQ